MTIDVKDAYSEIKFFKGLISQLAFSEKAFFIPNKSLHQINIIFEQDTFYSIYYGTIYEDVFKNSQLLSYIFDQDMTIEVNLDMLKEYTKTLKKNTGEISIADSVIVIKYNKVLKDKTTANAIMVWEKTTPSHKSQRILTKADQIKSTLNEKIFTVPCVFDDVLLLTHDNENVYVGQHDGATKLIEVQDSILHIEKSTENIMIRFSDLLESGNRYIELCYGNDVKVTQYFNTI